MKSISFHSYHLFLNIFQQLRDFFLFQIIFISFKTTINNSPIGSVLFGNLLKKPSAFWMEKLTKHWNAIIWRCDNSWFLCTKLFFWLGTYPGKAEQPLKGMELEEKEEDKEEKCIRKLIRKSPKITGDYQLWS